MAVPLFAGPGAISTLMVYSHASFHSNHDLIMGALIIAIVIIIGLLGAVILTYLISSLAQQVMNRLLGMVVGALGIEFVLEGLAKFFPALTT